MSTDMDIYGRMSSAHPRALGYKVTSVKRQTYESAWHPCYNEYDHCGDCGRDESTEELKVEYVWTGTRGALHYDFFTVSIDEVMDWAKAEVEENMLGRDLQMFR